MDIGCGVGNLTMLLAPYFQVVAGIDHALSGIRRATARPARTDRRPHYVVGDATRPPFDDDSLDYVFDRGCLQLIATERWPDYFAGLERVMKEGARYQLFIRRGGAPPALHSAVRYYLRYPMKLLAAAPRSQVQVLNQLPPAFVCETVENVPFLGRHGYTVNFTHIICRKS